MAVGCSALHVIRCIQRCSMPVRMARGYSRAAIMVGIGRMWTSAAQRLLAGRQPRRWHALCWLRAEHAVSQQGWRAILAGTIGVAQHSFRADMELPAAPLDFPRALDCAESP